MPNFDRQAPDRLSRQGDVLNKYGNLSRESETKNAEAIGDIKKLAEAVEKMNKTTRIFNKSMHFKLHEESNRWQVQIMDLDSGKVLREIPPKEVLDVVARIQEMVGLFVDERR